MAIHRQYKDSTKTIQRQYTDNNISCEWVVVCISDEVQRANMSGVVWVVMPTGCSMDKLTGEEVHESVLELVGVSIGVTELADVHLGSADKVL